MSYGFLQQRISCYLTFDGAVCYYLLSLYTGKPVSFLEILGDLHILLGTTLNQPI